MPKRKMKQLLALFLCGLFVRPAPMIAGSDATASTRAVLGSVTSRGMVQVGEVQVPGMSALFSGDQVRTLAGSAMVQYQDGVRVILGNESLASFSSARVELQKGRMSFSTGTGKPLFTASTLRIEPTSVKSAANVTLQDRKATVAVTEGTVKVVDPSGIQLASLRAGEARLFEEAAAAVPIPRAAAPAVPPPQAVGGAGNRAWLVVLGIGAVAIPLAIAKGLRGNDADSCGDQLRTQLIQAQAQVVALQAQVRNMRTQLAALAAAAAQQNVVISNLPAFLAEGNRLEAQLSDVQNRIARVQTAVEGTPCGSVTPAQISDAQIATKDLDNLFLAVQAFANEGTQLINQSGVVFSRTRLP